jgi:hypothetical protein
VTPPTWWRPPCKTCGHTVGDHSSGRSYGLNVSAPGRCKFCPCVQYVPDENATYEAAA